MSDLEPVRGWTHRPWFKVAINAVLRFVQTQRRPARIWVLASVFDGPDEYARLLGYKFDRVLHLG